MRLKSFMSVSDCSMTLHYCLAIKQACCTTLCKCEKSHSRTRTIDADVQSPLLTIRGEVKQFYATKSKDELEELMVILTALLACQGY